MTEFIYMARLFAPHELKTLDRALVVDQRVSCVISCPNCRGLLHSPNLQSSLTVVGFTCKRVSILLRSDVEYSIVLHLYLAAVVDAALLNNIIK